MLTTLNKVEQNTSIIKAISVVLSVGQAIYEVLDNSESNLCKFTTSQGMPLQEILGSA